MKDDEPISTSSPESEDSPSPQSGRASRQSLSASESLSLNESSARISPESPSSTTSENSTGATTSGQLSFPGDFLASLSAYPGSAEARKMTARSGAKWCELFPRRDPVGCLLKMLLASRRWGSTLCFLTWKVLATPARRSLFQLVPSTPRTDAKGYGLLPTPSRALPGWKHIPIVDKDGNFPTHQNQRFFHKKTGRLVQRGIEQVLRIFHTPSDQQVNGKLNPEFVEWVMGFPIGWTDCKALATPSSRKSLLKSSD